MLPNVIVVGAGLAGLSLSLGLAQLGIHVDLVEQRTNFNQNGATFGLAPNGIKALEELCPDAIETLHEQGNEIPGGAGLLLGWWMVRDALLEQVEKRNDKITIRNGWSVKDIDDDENSNSVKAYFSKSSCEAPMTDADFCEEDCLTLEGSLVVGCDGIRSRVREILDLPPALNSSATAWRGSFTVSEEHPILGPLLQQGVAPALFRCGPSVLKMFNFHATRPGSMAWVVTSTHPGIKEGVTPWDVFEPYAEKEKEINLVKAVIEMARKEDIQYPICNRVIPMPSTMNKGWGGRGRVALLGDSAHAMRPINGLGGSMAFEDGLVLCRLLRDPGPLADREATQELISKFENMRLPRVKRIWDDQWNRAERVYAGEKYEQWSKEYKEWVYSGV